MTWVHVNGFNAARTSTPRSVDISSMAATRSSTVVPWAMVRSRSIRILRARTPASCSPSIEFRTGARKLASGERSRASSASIRRSGSGSRSWNCTKAVPIKVLIPLFGLMFFRSRFGNSPAVSPLSTSIRRYVFESILSPRKNCPSDFLIQMFFACQAWRIDCASGRPLVATASIAGPIVLRELLTIKSLCSCRMACIGPVSASVAAVETSSKCTASRNCFMVLHQKGSGREVPAGALSDQ